MGINTAVCFLRKTLLLLAVILLHGNSFAESADRAAYPDLTRSLGFDLGQLQLLTHAGAIPGERPVFADFDGDNEADIARGRLVENRYEILVWLSTRSDVITLPSPMELAGFTIHAFDINRDSHQDVVATSPTEPHPLAVWLGDGKGNFKGADRRLFETDCGFTEAPAYQNGRLLPEQDSWTEPLYPVCEQAIAEWNILRPIPSGVIPFVSRFYRTQDESSCTTPRSPPADFLPI
jgi:hypothetical protein